MILIADSGSTKCHWVLCDANGVLIEEIKTIGFNPNFINEKDILLHLEESNLFKIKDSIETIFFYGAGCSSMQENLIIQKPLNKFFINAQVHVRHDLEAACKSVFIGEENITCILGTGSNSCYYNGKEIFENAPSLGFLIGDEASGNYFGKKILNLYFNNLLTDELKIKLEESCNTNLSNIKEAIYHSNRPNVFLAKYFIFISENKHHKIINEIILKALDDFFKLHIKCFNKYKEVKINFVGSVAYYLKEEIETTAKKYNCSIGKIIKEPIYKLVNFHFKNNNF